MSKFKHHDFAYMYARLTGAKPVPGMLMNTLLEDLVPAVERLEAEAARLREFAEWCADLEAARDLLGGMSDLEWFVAIEEKAKESLQESDNE